MGMGSIMLCILIEALILIINGIFGAVSAVKFINKKYKEIKEKKKIGTSSSSLSGGEKKGDILDIKSKKNKGALQFV